MPWVRPPVNIALLCNFSRNSFNMGTRELMNKIIYSCNSTTNTDGVILQEIIVWNIINDMVGKVPTLVQIPSSQLRLCYLPFFIKGYHKIHLKWKGTVDSRTFLNWSSVRIHRKLVFFFHKLLNKEMPINKLEIGFQLYNAIVLILWWY